MASVEQVRGQIALAVEKTGEAARDASNAERAITEALSIFQEAAKGTNNQAEASDVNNALKLAETKLKEGREAAEAAASQAQSFSDRI